MATAATNRTCAIEDEAMAEDAWMNGWKKEITRPIGSMGG